MAAGVFQALVRGLDGHTTCLLFSEVPVSVRDVKERLASRPGGPPAYVQRLVAGGSELDEEARLSADSQGHLPSLSLLLRLRGGKGGFGSLLRGAGHGTGKKTENFDACRDIHGRRLRHVNAEKNLVNWQQEAQERELEQQAMDYIKQQEREAAMEAGRKKVAAATRQVSDAVAERVADAVEAGLAAAAKDVGKGKRREEEGPQPSAKRTRMWETLEEEEEDEEGGATSTGGNDGEAGPFNGAPSTPDTEAAAPTALPPEGSPAHTDGASGVEESSLSGGGMPSHNDADDVAGKAEESGPSSRSGVRVDVVVKQTPALLMSSAKGGMTGLEGPMIAGNEGEAPSVPKASNSPVAAPAGSIDLSGYRSAQDLVVLGLDRLKAELLHHGLKCGGSLQERVARLFLLKDTAVMDLDPKHLAKKGPGGGAGKGQ